MSYNIGQFRRTQLALSEYYSNLTYEVKNYKHDEILDAAIEPKEIKKDSSYYLSFSVVQKNTSQIFNIYLWNSTKQIKQTLESYAVPAGNGESIFEIAYTPNSQYDKIIFAISLRDLSNAKDILEIKINTLQEITNVIETLKTLYPDLKNLKKMGLQGTSGMLVLINGEPIRIGRNNLYELEDDNIKVTSLGFVLKENSFWSDGYDQFILDFLYEKEEE